MFNRMMGKTRYIVCRLFLHLNGEEVAPILGVLNSSARTAINADGDLDILGEELVQLCQTFLQYDEYWFAAANEGDVFWNQGEAGDYVNELFTDSAQRYGANLDFNSTSSNQPLSLPVTRNIVVMITVAAEGEIPELETDLANIPALKAAFKAVINLHYKHKLRAIQVHFSPAQLGDELSSDQLLEYYPELIPL
ncbi:DUF1517 domain-containing protein [Dolichospermum sp. UHCC 0684]|jgi:uncharacterized membrane protein|uniref:DUF1517 domain-containing protein n=1 Tax=Dolichospermum TaxID=748770 RepID=UPI0007FD3736|nr:MULTISPECIES: DUF1517 domain-containing protein [Dolichospermum]MDB9448276.1 DUF1517 domain-containing protein [Dolichospermum circinale CS-547]MEA5531014.1 DUF1517 domain-containing protein [Dolichospermum sp. UHCC 0684]MTJ36773.1 DUF1517 domain-containing protein [Dolichospermum sp. UHCC 0260]OBQ41972.1 MAG: hypothetical protein AN485_00490 [Anabaena sp. MDT14b]